MSYRSSSPPVSGFAGHVPGNKWLVGSKSFNPSDNNSQIRSQGIDPEPTVLSDHSHTFDFEGNPIPRFTPSYFIPPPMTPAEYTQYYNQQMANFQAGANNGGAAASMMQQYSNNPMYGFNPALSMNGYPQNGVGMAASNSIQGLNNQTSQQSPNGNQQNSVNGQSRNDQSNGQSQAQQQKTRSKSMPRKPKSDIRDMFGGIESGWWSEGQALKNIRRHQQSQAEASGISAANSNNPSNDHTSSSSTNSRFRRRANNDADRDFDDDDVPAPGYSGFIPGIKTHGVGKPFTVAAKESRRIMHENQTQSNSSIQPKGKSDHGNSSQQQQHQNISQNNATRQGQQQQQQQQQQFIPPPSINGYPQQQQQQAFMNSYPFMTPNGMMQQPMYMGLPQQGQPQLNLPNNVNQPDF